MERRPRFTRRLAGILTAVALSAAAVTVAEPAQAADFSAPTITGLASSYTLPKSSSTITFAVTFGGAPADTNVSYSMSDESYNGPSITLLKSSSKAANVSKLYVRQDFSYSDVLPGNSLGLSISTRYYSTPGVYEVRVPIKQNDYSSGTRVTTVQWATAQFTLTGTAAVSKSQTRGGISGYIGKKFTGSFTAPDYYKGARLTLTFKAKGAKKYVKVFSGKLNANGYTKITVKKGVIKKTGKTKYTVSGVTYAPSYTLLGSLKK